MTYDGPFTLDDSTARFLDQAPALFIDGARVETADGNTLSVFDPSSGKIIGQAPDASGADVDRAVRSAHQAFVDGRWRNMRPADREKILFAFVAAIEENGEALAQLETLEQGKSIHLSRALEVAGAVEWGRFAAGLSTKSSGRTFDVSLPGGPSHWTAFTRREPVGLVAGIVPWNFPLLIAIWKIMPALAAGCSIVLKPSEFTPLSATILADLAYRAGVPAGVFNVVTGTGTGAGAALTAHPLVRKISFTGSTATGKAIGRSAIDAMKRVTLELGGKNAALVLKDADIANTIAGLAVGGFLNGGQVCAATSRVYVEAPIFDDIVSGLERALAGMSVGPGLDPQAQINPLASASHQKKVLGFLDDARAAGSEIRGGMAVPDAGYYVAPRLLLNPGDTVRARQDEVFGPLVNIVRIANAEEGVALANDSNVGLAASVWTSDVTQAMNLSRRLEAGTVWINSNIFIDPAMPFGGLKESGVGRDFGVDWLAAYSEEKAVCIAH